MRIPGFYFIVILLNVYKFVRLQAGSPAGDVALHTYCHGSVLIKNKAKGGNVRTKVIRKVSELSTLLLRNAKGALSVYSRKTAGIAILALRNRKRRIILSRK